MSLHILFWGRLKMQEYNVTIKINNENYTERVAEGTRFVSLAEKYQDKIEDKIVLVSANKKLRELNKKVEKDCELEFITLTQSDGRRAYRRSVTLLLQKAVYNLWKNEVHVRVLHSLGESYYCELEAVLDKNEGVEQCSIPINASQLAELKQEMRRLVEADFPIEKCNIKVDQAREMFHEFKMHDKELLMKYRRSSRVNIYRLDGMLDYYYGYMVPSTAYLQWFDLDLYEDGFVLMFPGKNGSVVEPLNTSHKLYHTLDEAKEWSRMLGVGTIGALNEAIAQGRGKDIILLQEALMEERIGAIAAQIAADDNKKFVMIAGPSSSGKTSFSNRLSIHRY